MAAHSATSEMRSCLSQEGITFGGSQGSHQDGRLAIPRGSLSVAAQRAASKMGTKLSAAGKQLRNAVHRAVSNVSGWPSVTGVAACVTRDKVG